MPRYLIALTLVLFMPLSAWADITGQPRVIDGDTIEIAGQRIRLHGIDAPESNQFCYLDGKRWQCGKDAGNILSDLINHRPVTCEEHDRNRYGRIVAVYYVGGEAPHG
jgi:endonuclease YncB( thermonuclease family)